MAQTATRKRGRAVTSSAYSDENSPKKIPNTSRRKAPARTQNGGANTTRLRNAAKTTKKGGKAANDAVTQIRARAQEILLNIEAERKNPTDETNSADGGGGGGRRALAAQCAMHEHDPLAGCEAFDEAKRALQQFRALVNRYCEVVGTNSCSTGSATATATSAEPTWMRWVQDAADMTALNDQAARTARQILEGHLAPAGWPAGMESRAKRAVEGHGSGADQDDLSQIALEILDEAVPTASTLTWGAAATQVVDAYGRILGGTR